MASMFLAISGRAEYFHLLRCRLVNMGRLHLDYHLVRNSHHLALWSDLKTHRGNDPTILIRVDLFDSIF